MTTRQLVSFIVALVVTASAGRLLADGSTNRVVSFALKDQFNNEMILKPPFAKPVLVTIADRDGAEELDSWIQPLKQDFSGQIQFFAVADLRSVPAPLRGLVRRGFRKDYALPVALDWRGEAADQVTLRKDHANLLLLDAQGRELLSLSGVATEPKLAQLRSRVREMIALDHAVALKQPAEKSDP